MVEDRDGKGYAELEKAANALIAQANQTKGLAGVYTFFETATPRIFADIDRVKAQILGVKPEKIFETVDSCACVSRPITTSHSLLIVTLLPLATCDASRSRAGTRRQPAACVLR